MTATAIIMYAVSATFFLLSVRSFFQKGFLLNNAYIYSSKNEREKMNKKPYYRQTAVVLLLMGAIFALNGTALLLEQNMLYIAVGVLVISAVVYAVVSSIIIEKEKIRVDIC